MIDFILNEGKILRFNISVEGISKSSLEYRFIILWDNIEIGFIGVISGNKIQFEIPPLISVMEGILPGEYKAKFIAHSKDTFIEPWSEIIQVVKETNINVTAELDDNDDAKHIVNRIFKKSSYIPKYEVYNINIDV